MSNKKTTSAKAETKQPAPAPVAAQPETPATPAPASTNHAKPLVFRQATLDQLKDVPKAPATSGLRSQVAAAIKELPVRGGIIVENEEFVRVRRTVGSINRNKLIKLKDDKGAELLPRYYVREHEGIVYVIRES
jgi:hypothetical protein